jgi:solute carrier family 29 (equilibrative nucleoside transporter) protein 4
MKVNMNLQSLFRFIFQMVASISYDWSRTNMLIFAGCRVLLVPLILLCAMPRGRPYIPGEWYPMVFSVLLGLTNGQIGSMPMILAPSRVSEEHRELTGEKFYTSE